MPSLVLRFDRDDISRMFQYGVMVETWDKVVGRSACSSKRRRYHETFTNKERRTISEWHNNFRRWYLVTGPPAHLDFRAMKTVDLLRQAIEFFATV